MEAAGAAAAAAERAAACDSAAEGYGCTPSCLLEVGMKYLHNNDTAKYLHSGNTDQGFELWIWFGIGLQTVCTEWNACLNLWKTRQMVCMQVGYLKKMVWIGDILV